MMDRSRTLPGEEAGHASHSHRPLVDLSLPLTPPMRSIFSV